MRVAFLIALLVAGSMISGLSWAGGFRVSPVRVELSDGQKSAALTVHNDGDQPVVVQVQPMAWSQSDGHDSYRATDDILATPPIFTVKPDSSQIVRIGVRRPLDPDLELSYRVYLQEIPPAPGPGFQGLQVALRLGLPVFVQEQNRAVPVLNWKVERVDKGRISVRATNAGKAHIQVTDFSLVLPNTGKPVAVQQVSAYLLPGQTHEWVLAAEPARISNGVSMRLKAYTDAGNIDTEVIMEKKQ